MSAIGPELPPHLVNDSTNTDDRNEEALTSNTVGPQIPPSLLKQDEEEDEDDYVPELPPDMIAGRSTGLTAAPSTSKRVVGPSMPSYPPTYDPRYHTSYSDDDEDDDDDFGPKPLPAGVRHVEIDPVKQFMEKEEKRRKEVEVRDLYSSCYICPDHTTLRLGSSKTQNSEARRMDVGPSIIL
jgi:hypothetical protein